MHHSLHNKLACPQATCKTAYIGQESSSDNVDPSENHRDAGKSPGYYGKLQPADPSGSGPFVLASELSPLLSDLIALPSDPVESSKQKMKKNQRGQDAGVAPAEVSLARAHAQAQAQVEVAFLQLFSGHGGGYSDR